MVNNKPTRHLGLDILRIIAIISVTTIHFTAYSGLLQSDSISQGNIVLFKLIKLIYVNMNFFVLLSGYYLWNKQFSLKRIIKLWAKVLFVSMILIIVSLILFPDSFSIVNLCKSLLPLFAYWYIFAYSILYLLSPVLNRCINSLSKKEHFFVCVGGVIAICVFSAWNPMIEGKEITGSSGSLFWFIYLYFVSSYLSKYGIKIKKKIIVFVLSITCMLRFIISIFNIDVKLSKINISDANSLLPFLFSISAFALFALTKGKTEISIVKRLVSSLAESSLLVYLIQEHPMIRDSFWNLFPINAFSDKWSLILLYLIAILCLWPLAILLNYLFECVYKKFISTWYDKVYNTIKAKVFNIMKTQK